MISAVFVSYRSAALARTAIESFRAEAARLPEPSEVIVVVTSDDPSELEALAPHADRAILTRGNAGFAGGLNAGLAASRGDVLFLANPDIVFLPGSVAELGDAVAGRGLVAAGPAFYSDAGCTLFQPPADEPHPFELARGRLGRSRDAGERLFRRDLRRAQSAFGAACSASRVPAQALRGALVATNRQTLDLAGPFDEGYRLYYEENDWQRRLRALGGRLVYAGGARVVHLYNQSARTEPKAGGWFAESQRRYFLSHFGEAGRSALEALASSTAAGVDRPLPLLDGARVKIPGPRRAETPVAVSPSPAFRPVLLAAIPAGESSWQPAKGILEAMRGSRWFARAFDPLTLETLAEGELPVG
jgi:GT2 family glycosyltransferase